MYSQKFAYAAETNLRTLQQAMEEVDVFLGVWVARTIDKKWPNQWQYMSL